MNDDLIAGLLATFIPLFVVGFLFLRRQAVIFRLFVALLLVGIGYLTATGAINDIGAKVKSAVHGSSPATSPAPAPAPQ